MNLRLTSLIASFMVATGVFAQGANDLKLNEVFIANPAQESAQPSLLDEYGQPTSWIEIANTSYATRDIATFYLTTNRKALDVNLTPEERKALMSRVPSGDLTTKIGPKQYLVFFADGQKNRSALHTNFVLKPGEENFIALFNGNAIDLIDSVTVKPLPEGCSYARIEAKGETGWQIVKSENISPKSSNDLANAGPKESGFKTKDPHGFAMAIIAMGIVFSCLIMLFICFRLLGMYFTKRDDKKALAAAAPVAPKAEAPAASEGNNDDAMAAIALALYEYQGGMHDVESGVLTIMPTHTQWTDPQKTLRHVPTHHHAHPVVKK